MQKFPLYSLYHLGTYFGKDGLFKMAESVHDNQRGRKRWTKLNIYDVSSLVAVGRGAAGIFLKKSAI